MYKSIKKYIGTTDMIDGCSNNNDYVGYIIKTGYSADMSELFDDPTFCDEIIGNHKCKVDIIHNDYDELKQSLYCLIKVDNDTCGLKSFSVSFKDAVRKYNEDEKDVFMNKINDIFEETEYYDC